MKLRCRLNDPRTLDFEELTVENYRKTVQKVLSILCKLKFTT
jgi:hypothetical protein